MRTLFLVLLFLSLAAQAHADDFSFTGYTSQEIDGTWLPGNGGFTSGSFTGGNYLGGPGGNDIGGLAQQFEVYQNTQFTSLDIQVVTFPQGSGTTTITYNIYTNTSNTLEGNPSQPRPDANSLSYTSPSSTQTTTNVPFNTDLKPGNYWLAEQGTGPTEVEYQSITYEGDNVAQTPEPPILIFFLALAGFVFFKRKKHVAMERVV